MTEGILRVNGSKKDAFTRQHQPKDAACLLKSCWERLPVDYKVDKQIPLNKPETPPEKLRRRFAR